MGSDDAADRALDHGRRRESLAELRGESSGAGTRRQMLHGDVDGP